MFYVRNDETVLHAHVWTGSISTDKTIFIHPYTAIQAGNTPKVFFGGSLHLYSNFVCARSALKGMSVLRVHARSPKRYVLDKCAHVKPFLYMHG